MPTSSIFSSSTSPSFRIPGKMARKTPRSWESTTCMLPTRSTFVFSCRKASFARNAVSEQQEEAKSDSIVNVGDVLSLDVSPHIVDSISSSLPSHTCTLLAQRRRNPALTDERTFERIGFRAYRPLLSCLNIEMKTWLRALDMRCHCMQDSTATDIHTQTQARAQTHKHSKKMRAHPHTGSSNPKHT